MTKKQVDNFREGKLIPHCQLKAEVIGKKEEVSSLKHNITLLGAKYPHNILTVDAKGIFYFINYFINKECIIMLLQIFHSRGIKLN